MDGLKLRLAVYSLFGKRTYSQYKQEYQKEYEKLAKVEIKKAYEHVLKHILDSGYDIRIATKNVCAQNILLQECFEDVEIKEKLKLIVLIKNKKQQFKQLLKDYNNNICVIGNNFTDDIISACKIGSPYIYVGKSKILKRIISNKYYSENGIIIPNIEEIKNMLIS